MKDFLDDLKYNLSYHRYQLADKLGGVYGKAKFPIITLTMCAWGSFIGLGIYEGFIYESKNLKEVVYVAPEVAEETIAKAEQLIQIGSKSEAFKLLATHKNNFSNEYSGEQLERVDSLLTSLVNEAEEVNIDSLYLEEDLRDVLPIYKFTGVVNSVDHDPLYGNTRTVSHDGTRSKNQVEVKGLTDAVVGSYVTFYGVPEFNSVDRPISVEAYLYVEPQQEE